MYSYNYVLLSSIAKKYKIVQRSKVGGAGQYTFSWRVFTSWDFTITENKTAKIKMKQHGIGMKEALFEASKKKEKDLKEK